MIDPLFFQSAGLVISGAVVAQAALRVASTLRASAAQARQRRVALEILETKLGYLRSSLERRQQSEGSWSGWRKFEVRRKLNEGGGITSFYLAPHDQRALPGYEPGQYLTFQLNIPGQSKPVIRCYSLSDCPNPSYYRVSIKKIPAGKAGEPAGLASCFFHDHVKEGDILDVKAPSGHFHLDTGRNTPVVLIGGGIGVTPVLSMLNHIVESKSGREVWFYYGVRSRAEHIMAERLDRIAKENENVRLFICYSQNDAPPPPPPPKPTEDESFEDSQRIGSTGGTPRLVQEATGEERVLIKPEISVGRKPGMDIILNEGTVSGKHARLYRTAEGWFLEDLGSTNGTYLRAERIKETVRLKEGDQISFGEVRFRFTIPASDRSTLQGTLAGSRIMSLDGNADPSYLIRGQRVSVELMSRHLPSSNYDFYICGPGPFMESIVTDLKGWGVPEHNIHFEAFGPSTVKKAARKGDERTTAAGAAAVCEVTFARSGKKAPWSAGAGTLLELAEANGIVIDSGCRAGNCGSCITAVKSGNVDYLSPPGSPPEAGSCLTCIATPKGDVTLDA